MTFATNNDLQTYQPDVFDHGVEDWTDELALAETDVKNYIQIEYWNKHRSRSSFDETLLTETQWTKATVYCALTNYVFPRLATFRLDDTFVEKGKFFKERYAEEMDIQFALGIQYDFNEDAVVQDNEVIPSRQDRLYR